MPDTKIESFRHATHLSPQAKQLLFLIDYLGKFSNPPLRPLQLIHNDYAHGLLVADEHHNVYYLRNKEEAADVLSRLATAT